MHFPHDLETRYLLPKKSSVSTLEECDLRKFPLTDVQGNGTRSWSRSGSHGCERQLNKWYRDVRGIFNFTGIWCQLHAVDQRRCRHLFSLTLLPYKKFFALKFDFNYFEKHQNYVFDYFSISFDMCSNFFWCLLSLPKQLQVSHYPTNRDENNGIMKLSKRWKLTFPWSRLATKCRNSFFLRVRWFE